MRSKDLYGHVKLPSGFTGYHCILFTVA